RTEGRRLALESLSEGLTLRDMLGQDFDSHEAIEARVARFVHFAHASSAEWREDFVGAKMSTRIQAHGFLNFRGQLRTTVMGVTAPSIVELTRKRLPSDVT